MAGGSNQRTYIRDGFVSAGNAQVTGSLGVTGGITGSLLGTATTASYISPTFISSSAAASGFGGGSVTINNNTNDYVITATGTANTLNGESALTFNGTTLGVGVTTPYASVKAHIKGILGVENGSTAGTLADQLLFGYNGSGLTQYNHKIQTSHDAQAALNKMDFLVSNGASTFLNVLNLRSSGLSRFDSGQGLGVSGSLQVTGSVIITGNANASSFTGSLFGTASYATQALSASYAPSAGGAAFPFTGSAIITGSLTVTGSFNVTGNVGIGTTSPGSLLQVGRSGATATATPTAIQMDNSYRNAVGGNTSLKFYLYKNSGEGYGFGLNNAAGIEYHAGVSGGGTAYHAFYTDTTEKIRITADGSVGIGTTTPSAKLDVNGNVQITGALYNSSFAFISGGLVVGSELGGYVQSGNHKSQIIAAGTQTPLMIQGGSGAVEIWQDTTPSTAVSFGMAVPGNSITSDFIFSAYQPGWTETMRITSADGNVGIGTTTPSAKLDVNGNTVITGTLLVSGEKLVAGYSPTPLQGTIQDGVTSILGSLNDWDSDYYQGTVLYSETAGGTITFGQLCYRKQNETWALADATTANAAAAFNMLGICVKSSTATNPTSILINGFVETTNYATTVKSGEPLYMATTPGSMTKTAPTTAGNAVRLIGNTFWDSNSPGKKIIRFNPENSWIEL